MSSCADPAPTVPAPSAATDPGQVDVIESLYRDSGRNAALRRFEPALRPPEDADGYSWLYRPEQVSVPALALEADTLTAQPLTVVAGRRWLVPALLALGSVGAALVALLLAGS